MSEALIRRVRSHVSARGEPDMFSSALKEVLHHHVLHALGASGALDHVVFQGGTALRLAYGGDRYSEDLDFVIGDVLPPDELSRFVENAFGALRRALTRDYSIAPELVSLKPPTEERLFGAGVGPVTWRLDVVADPEPRRPKSRVKVEFARVPSHDHAVRLLGPDPALVQLPSTAVLVESPAEILADKALALVGRPVLKHRDIWDVQFLTTRLGAKPDPDLVAKKAVDYGMPDVLTGIEKRLSLLRDPEVRRTFTLEMSRFVPADRLQRLSSAGAVDAMFETATGYLEDLQPGLGARLR